MPLNDEPLVPSSPLPPTPVATGVPQASATGPVAAATPAPAPAESIRRRVQRESRLIARLMATETQALHDECEALGVPHEGRTPNELRAALFTHLRRRV